MGDNFQTTEGVVLSPFKAGEVIGFFGDSLTHQGYYHYALSRFMALRHPEIPVTLMNLGKGGDSARSSLMRIEDDVVKVHPNRVFVMFGGNDIGFHLYMEEHPDEENLKMRRQMIEAFKANMSEICDRLGNAGIDVVLMMTSTVDEYGTWQKVPPVYHNINDGISEAVAFVRRLAAARGLPCLNINSVDEELLRAYPELPLGGADRLHRTPEMHQVWTYHIMRALGEKGPSSSLTIDVATRDVKEEGCMTSSVMTTRQSLSLDYCPLAFPFNVLELTGRVCPGLKALSRVDFSVNGLAEGEYVLKCDGVEIGCLDAERLKAGIDLGELNTPMKEVSAEVDRIMEEIMKLQTVLSDINYVKYTLINLGFNPDDPLSREEGMKKYLARPNLTSYHQFVLEEAFVKHYDERGVIAGQIADLRKRLYSVPAACAPFRMELSKR